MNVLSMDEFLSSFLVPLAIVFVFLVKIVRKFVRSTEEYDESELPPLFDEELPEEKPDAPVYNRPQEKTFATYKREQSRYVSVEKFSAPKPEKTEAAASEPSEFAITGKEEARKAIIWSEILQRKFF